MKKGNRISVRLTGADIEQSLTELANYGIHIYDVRNNDTLQATFFVDAADRDPVKNLLTPKGDAVEFYSVSLFDRILLFLKFRFLMISGCLVFFALTFFVPSKIFFIEIVGNERIPERLILEKVTQQGLTFGAERKSIRSSSIKNSLLTELPALEWAGVTTKGCVAQVAVREKPLSQQNSDNKYRVSSIIASCDGVVEEITVTSGTQLCQKGQAVREGQVLISGYEDCGFVIKAGEAQGEIIAQTFRNITAVFPQKAEIRGNIVSVEKKYSLMIGKNIINFNKNSGISPAGCAKIYEEKYVTLPGGFQLPIAVVTEQVISYEINSNTPVILPAENIADISDRYLKSQMVAGEILHKTTASEELEEMCRIATQYHCREQIGIKRIEETLEYYGKNS